MAENTEETEPQIHDEAAFARALGLNPDHIKSGTIRVEVQRDGAALHFESVYPVPARSLGVAFLVAAGATIHDEDDTPGVEVQEGDPV